MKAKTASQPRMDTDGHGWERLDTNCTNSHEFLARQFVSICTMPQNVCRLRKFLVTRVSNRKDTKSAKTELLSPFLCALRVFAVDSDASNLVAAPLLCAIRVSPLLPSVSIRVHPWFPVFQLPNLA